jgi:hypothetical protein
VTYPATGQNAAATTSSSASWGQELARLRCGQQSRADNESVLELECRLESRDVGVVGEQKEVAPQAEVERLSDLVLEALQPSDRLEPDPNVEIVGEERADATGAVTRRAGSDCVTPEEQRVCAATLGEVVEGGGADDPAAHHDGVATFGEHRRASLPLSGDGRGRAPDAGGRLELDLQGEVDGTAGLDKVVELVQVDVREGDHRGDVRRVGELERVVGAPDSNVLRL